MPEGEIITDKGLMPIRCIAISEMQRRQLVIRLHMAKEHLFSDNYTKYDKVKMLKQTDYLINLLEQKKPYFTNSEGINDMDNYLDNIKKEKAKQQKLEDELNESQTKKKGTK